MDGLPKVSARQRHIHRCRSIFLPITCSNQGVKGVFANTEIQPIYCERGILLVRFPGVKTASCKQENLRYGIRVGGGH